MPELPCCHCERRCSMFLHSQFHMRFLFAWANNSPAPECVDFREVRFHGLEGVRP